MKIRTQETVTKYETWEYAIEGELPEGFHDWNGEDKASWLSKNLVDARMIDSDYANLSTIDEYDVII